MKQNGVWNFRYGLKQLYVNLIICTTSYFKASKMVKIILHQYWKVLLIQNFGKSRFTQSRI